jgi:endonuclease/exonuclease/phosphatase family metal-dependent hydrolase
MNRAGFLSKVVSGLMCLSYQVVPAEESVGTTFCSYNLRNWLQMERNSVTGEKLAPAPKPEEEKQRVVEILVRIRPDVLGVCEIGDENDLRDLQTRLKKAGVNLPHFEMTRGGDPVRSLALLSRHPITERRSQSDLTYQIGAKILPMQRGILDATVQLSEGLAVRMIGVHLKSKREVTEADEGLMRRAEASLLRSHLNSIFDKQNNPLILCYGDFNEYRNEPAIMEVMGPRSSPHYLHELPLRDSNGLVWTHFWDAADVYSRLDFIFCSRALRPMIDLRRGYIYSVRDFDKASDHRPLVIKIQPKD